MKDKIDFRQLSYLEKLKHLFPNVLSGKKDLDVLKTSRGDEYEITKNYEPYYKQHYFALELKPNPDYDYGVFSDDIMGVVQFLNLTVLDDVVYGLSFTDTINEEKNQGTGSYLGFGSINDTAIRSFYDEYISVLLDEIMSVKIN